MSGNRLAFLTAAKHDPVIVMGTLTIGVALVAWLLASFTRKKR